MIGRAGSQRKETEMTFEEFMNLTCENSKKIKDLTGHDLEKLVADNAKRVALIGRERKRRERFQATLDQIGK
jgi:hypothetical protein